MTNLCRFYTLFHECLQTLGPIISVVDEIPTKLFRRFSVRYSKKILNPWADRAAIAIAMIEQMKKQDKKMIIRLGILEQI